MRAKRRAEKQAKLKALKEQGLSLLPKRTVKRLAMQGIDVVRYLRLPMVSRAEYDDLIRTLKAKQARIEMQSGGIKTLQEEVRQLHALIQAQAGFLLEGDKETIKELARKALEAQEPIQPNEPPPPGNFRKFVGLHSSNIVDMGIRMVD